MGEEEERTLFAGERRGVGGGWQRASEVQAVGEDVTGVGRELDAGEDEEAGAFSEGGELVFGPGPVVLGQADAVETTGAGKLDELLRLEGAAGRAREDVAVEVNEHDEKRGRINERRG